MLHIVLLFSANASPLKVTQKPAFHWWSVINKSKKKIFLKKLKLFFACTILAKASIKLMKNHTQYLTLPAGQTIFQCFFVFSGCLENSLPLLSYYICFQCYSIFASTCLLKNLENVYLFHLPTNKAGHSPSIDGEPTNQRVAWLTQRSPWAETRGWDLSLSNPIFCYCASSPF